MKLSYDSRILLVALAVKYDGNYEKIMSAIALDEEVPYEDAMKIYNSLKCHVVTLLDYDYPFKLRQAYKPPVVLFYYGDISLFDKQMVATVGSRDCSEYDLFCTEKIVSGLAKDRVIISGLARGIDTCAHKTAIAAGGRTIAVLGTGIDICYPAENKELYEEIKKHHLLVSEYPGTCNTDPSSFPNRNRIVIALSDAVYIPAIRSYMSGTMTSITIALTMGKPVFMPYHAINDGSINNDFIFEGATPVTEADDLLTEMKWK